MDPINIAIAAGKLYAKVKTALVIGGSAIAVASISGAQAAIQKKRLKDAAKKARSRVDVMLRSGVEPQRIIYGTRRVSGVLCYANVRRSTGTNDNSDLWQIIALAGHQVSGITDLYLDGDKIDAANIDSTGSTTGGKYAPISGRSPVQVLLNDGADDQTSLNIGFSDWTSAHRMRGIAHIATRFELSTRGSANLWRNGAPTNVRVVVQGKKVYDPRRDSTQTTISGSGSHRLADPTTWEYSANSALVLADYLIDSRLGMGQEGVTSSDVDYELVATAADQCDVSVAIPGGTEARYETHGVLFTTDSHEENIRQLLRPMNGQLTWSNGKFRIRAGEYAAPVLSFTEDDVIGPIAIVTERGRDERANKIRGSYANAAEDYEQMQYLPVENATLKSTRDAGTSLVETIDQGMVTSETQCQRLAIKLLSIGNQQMQATIPLRYTALNCVVGDRVEITVASCGWSQKIFRVTGWRFSGLTGGFEIDVVEDDSTAYADPAESEYSQRTSSGAITFAAPPVPSPSGLTATPERNGILVQWDEPEPPSLFDEVQVFASATSSFGNAAQIASTRGTAFFHDLNPGTQRYYWVRSIDSVDEVSDRNPDSDTSSVQATAGAVGAADVDGVSAGQNLVSRIFAEPQSWTTQFSPTFRAAGFSGVLGLDPGDAISASAEVKRASGSINMQLYLQFNDAGGTSLGTATSSVTSIGTSYQRLTVDNATIPANADEIVLFFLVSSPDGVQATQRRMMLCRGPVALPFEQPPARVNRGEVEEGAQVNGGGSLALVINRQLDDTAQPGEACLLGIVDGEPNFSTDGVINWNGSRITVDRVQRGSTTAGVSLLTGAARSVGQIAFDTAKSNPFTVQGTAVDVAFVRQTATGWQYDNNGNWVSFTPASYPGLVSLGVMDAGSDVIHSGSLWGQPILLTDAPEARSDVTGDHAADIDVLLTQNAPSEAGADVTGNHAADIDVLLTINAPAEANANRTTNTNQLTDGAGLGNRSLWSGVTGTGRPEDNADVTGDHAADINVLLTQNAPSEANADRTGNHAADIDVLLTQNAPAEANANRTTNTNQLTDGAGLGNTSLWSGVTGTGRPEDNADVTGNHAADINVLLTQNAPSEANADRTGNHAADINVLLTQNAPAEAGADVTGDHAADINVLLTQNAPAEAGADVTGNHAADIDVLLTQNAPSEASADRTANHAADIDVLQTQNAPAEAGADVTGNHAADIDVLNTQNAPAEAGADVTGNHAADIDVLSTQNAPADAGATQNTFFRSTTAPTANGVGDLWYDTDDDIQYRWSGSAWVQFAPTGGNTGIVVSDSGSGTTSASATITRGGAPTTILVNVEIAGSLIGGGNPFPATYRLRRGGSGGTVIKTWSSVGGFYEAGNGSTEPAVAEMNQSLVYIDSNTGTGSTEYHVSGPTTPYSESIEIEITQTYFA